MAFISMNESGAHISDGFAIPPYHVEEFPIGACVCNKNGFNVLEFTNKPGAKFTSKVNAEKICGEFNK